MRWSSSALFILGNVLLLVILSGCRPPTVLNPIADVQAVVGEPNRDLDLSTVFTDPDPFDQGRLTLAVVENTDANVVTATLTGTTLTLAFQVPGQARITVRATDRLGMTADASFLVTVSASSTPLPPPAMVTPETQVNVVGEFIADLFLSATGCNPSCIFGVSGLPPNLQIDPNTGRIFGGIAYTAFTQGPEYTVSATATNNSTNLISPAVSFAWRTLQYSRGDDGGGDGDGDGDGGDGGAGGDAGDGGDLSPIAGAICRFVGIDGQPFLDNAGNEIQIQDEADANGQFFLTIPQDPNNPGFLRALQGFIECRPPDRINLVISTYLDTTGLRSGERLVGLSVNPLTSVFRTISNGFATVNAAADRVAIHARLLSDIAGLQTQSPSAIENTLPADLGCCEDPNNPGTPCMQAVREMNIPLDAPPGTPKESGRRGGMAAYIASQLFLAALKGEEVDLGDPIPLEEPLPDCQVPLDQQTPEGFQAVLDRYFRNRTVVATDLVRLGLAPDEGIPRTTTLSCD